MKRFHAEGGLIITDRSNRRGGNFKKMIRSNGLTKRSWKFALLLEQTLAEQQFQVISATPAL